MKICSLDDCDKEVKRKGNVCSMHYHRKYRWGSYYSLKRDTPNSNPPEFCKIDNCGRKYFSKGFCKMHYHRSRSGSDNMDIVESLRNPNEICLHEGCTRKKRALKLCTMHYQRLKRYGSADVLSYGAGNEPTYVYRLYDESGNLLYVGITNDIKTRLYAHSLDKFWWNDVAKINKHKYSTREQAQKIELNAIKKYSPVYNVTFNKKAA